VSYATERAALSRTPCTMVTVKLTECSEVNGVAPCTATATCNNTYSTCKDLDNFNNVTVPYNFVSAEVPFERKQVSFIRSTSAGEDRVTSDGETRIVGEYPNARPYVQSVTPMPTEIKPGELTIKGRETIEFADDEETDGSYWKKLLARNPHWKGRTVERYEGFIDSGITEFEMRWAGKIDNIKLDKGKIKFQLVDLLQDMDKLETPPKVSVTLSSAATNSATTISIDSIIDISAAGYGLIDDEIIQWTGLNETQYQLTGVTRGKFNTTAATHKDGVKFSLVAVYGGNPFDILEGMLTDAQDITTDNPPGAEIDAARVDSAAFSYWRDWPATDINFQGVITEPTKLGDLFFEIVSLLDCMVWQDENQKITIRRNVPNEPDRTYTTITDDANIIAESTKVDLNDESRNTRIVLYWDKRAGFDDEEVDSYRRIDVTVDAGAEGADQYNEIQEEKIWCRWITTDYIQEEVATKYVTNLIRRRLFDRVDAHAIIDYSVELKDEGVQTGDHVQLTTDELLLPDGSVLDAETFRIWKRNPKGNKIAYRAWRVMPNKFCFIAPNDTPVYGNATPAQKEYGYICRDDGRIDNDNAGYHIW